MKLTPGKTKRTLPSLKPRWASYSDVHFSILTGLPENLIHEDEQALAVRIQKEKREDDINTLVLHNLREALAYGRTCCRCVLSEKEVLSICYTALRKAAPRFRPGGIRFFAYAKQDVRGEIARHWRTLDVVANSSQHAEEEKPELRYRTITGVMGEDAEENITESDYEPIEPDYAEPEYDLIEMRERWALVEPMLHRLNDRERTVLRLHYEAGFSFEQIAAMLVPRVSRQTIGNTHSEAIAKLQKMVRKTNLQKGSTCGTFE